MPSLDRDRGVQGNSARQYSDDPVTIAREAVRREYPLAWAEVDDESAGYWFVFDVGGLPMPWRTRLGSGATERDAWLDAEHTIRMTA